MPGRVWDQNSGGALGLGAQWVFLVVRGFDHEPGSRDACGRNRSPDR